MSKKNAREAIRVLIASADSSSIIRGRARKLAFAMGSEPMGEVDFNEKAQVEGITFCPYHTVKDALKLVADPDIHVSSDCMFATRYGFVTRLQSRDKLPKTSGVAKRLVA